MRKSRGSYLVAVTNSERQKLPVNLPFSRGFHADNAADMVLTKHKQKVAPAQYVKLRC